MGQKERKALIIALAALVLTGAAVAGILTIFGNVHACVPIVAGFAGGIITYASIAPEL